MEVHGLRNQTKNLETLLEAEADMKKAAEAKNAELTKELESLRITGEEKIKAAFEEFKKFEDDRVKQRCAEMDARLIPVYPEVRNPKDPWAVKEEMMLEDAIAASISRAEKKKKCRVVYRTHGIGSAHHARSDGIPVSAPTVVSQGLAILLADAATHTEAADKEEEPHPRLQRRALIPSPKLRFALSTSPLDCGCFTEAKRYVIFNFSHQSLNGLSLKCFIIVVRNYFSYETEAAHYVVPYELLHLIASDCRHGFRLYPLCEIVYSDYKNLTFSGPPERPVVTNSHLGRKAMKVMMELAAV
ncbi:hypothetical protein Tco_0496784 [Tanacetum coccineum]